MLHVKALGGLTITNSNGESIDFPARKARALFLYLACHGGRKFPRESLAALLWDDSADAQARASLRQVVSSLRKELALAGEADALDVGRETVCLGADHIELDVDQFRATDGGGAFEDLQQAVALYDGDFAGGVTTGSQGLDDWIVAQRFNCREQYLDVMTLLLEAYTETSDFGKAIATAAQILFADELREEVHVSLMKLYARVGRHGAAIKQYRRCQEVLRRELGVAPAAKTQELYSEVSSVRRAQRRKPDTAPSPIVATEVDELPRMEGPPPASIAVIPFLNMSSDPEQDYFSDGLSEELINLLARIKELRVAARTSSFQYKGKSTDMRAIGRALNVTYVLEGSVRKSARRIRITAQLIDAGAGYHILVGDL